MSRKIVSVVLCVLLLMGTMSACASKQMDALVIGTTMDIEKVNRNDYYWDVLTGTVSQLAPVYLDEDGNFNPLLTDFSTVDSKSWILTVKEGAKWHDGVDVTAEDIKFTIEYLDEQNGGGYLDIYQEINVIDSANVEMVLKTANARYLSNLTTLRIIPKHIYEGRNMAEVGETESAIGCGPYKFVKYDPDSLVAQFEAVDDFFMGEPKVKNVVYKFYDNADTLTMAMDMGEVDVIYYYASGLDIAGAEKLSANANVTITGVKDTSNTAVLVFNNNKAPFDNVLIRKAVSKAIDYDKFVELFGSEYSSVANAGFVPAGSLGYIDTEINSKDIQKAKDYLAQAGAVDSNGDGVVEYNGSPLSVELLVRSDKAIYQRYGELIKLNLAEIGIDVTLKLTEVADFRAISEQQHSNDFMISKFTAYGMGMGAGMGSAYMDGRKTSNAQGQVMDSRYHQIVDDLSSAADIDSYIQAASDCQEFYAEETPAIAIYWDSYLQAHRSDLAGFVVDGTFGLININTWFNIEAR